MLVNSANLEILFQGFKTTFNKGFLGAPNHYGRIAMTVPSTTREESYGWLGQFPAMREWLGGRVINNLTMHSYKIVNKAFENTVAVKKDDISDDQYGIYAPLFGELGRAAGELPNQLVFALLTAGFTTPCYDGQYFFDTDHPVGRVEEAAPVSVSNFQGGDGAPWYLLDTTKFIKPMIFQEREKLGNLVRKDSPSDDNVFNNREFIYGTDGRCNVGFGLWQLAYASKQELTPENYAAARAAMMKMKGDEGRPLGITPNLLVVGPDLEEAALKLLNSENGTAGESNPWKGTADPLVSVWAA